MGEPHALIVPGLGQGHLNASLLLSKALCSVGFKVSFVYFSSIYTQLKKKNLLEDSIESSIAVHVVDDGRDPDLPPDMSSLQGNSTMEENLYKLLIELQQTGHGVTCLISDSFVPWSQDVAERAGVARVEFWTSNAFSYLMITNCDTLFNRGLFPEKGSPELWKRENLLILDHIPGLNPFPSYYYPPELRFRDVKDPLVQFFIKMEHYHQRSKHLLVHSVLDLENEAFNALNLGLRQAYSIGPLLHYHSKSQNTKHVDPCLTWLNKHPPKSVLYIAFGSHFKLSKDDIRELAHALEERKCPFLWALPEGNLEEVLPHGFLANTSVNGMIIPWAPQKDVLAHPSVGGFLSHCGWNSTLESLWCGMPIIGCPRGAEQYANMNYIANLWRVGFELERTPNGGIEKRGILNCIKKLMEEEVGQQVRYKAQQIMELMRNTSLPGGQSMSNLEKFYEEMKTLCPNKK